jgi:hypothetical protein
VREIDGWIKFSKNEDSEKFEFRIYFDRFADKMIVDWEKKASKMIVNSDDMSNKKGGLVVPF